MVLGLERLELRTHGSYVSPPPFAQYLGSRLQSPPLLLPWVVVVSGSVCRSLVTLFCCTFLSLGRQGRSLDLSDPLQGGTTAYGAVPKLQASSSFCPLVTPLRVCVFVHSGPHVSTLRDLLCSDSLPS